jgi:hypothetical protein
MNNEEDEEECVSAYETLTEVIDLHPAVTEIQRIMVAIREEAVRAKTCPRWRDKVAKSFGCDPPETATQKQLWRELFNVGAWCYERGGKLAMRTVSYRVVKTVVDPQAKIFVKTLINENWRGLYERAPD